MHVTNIIDNDVISLLTGVLDLAVAVLVELVDHLLGLFVRHLLAAVHHDELQVGARDVAAVLGVKHCTYSTTTG